MAETWLDLAEGPRGWVEATFGGLEPSYRDVYVQLRKDDEGRWGPTGALVVPGLTPENIRAVPLRRILLAVEASETFRRNLEKRIDEPAAEPGSDEFRDSFSDWRYEAEVLEPLKLERPKKRNLPDEFYAQVAGVYRAAVLRGLRPRTAIAEAAGVSGEVAGRWIRQARRRDYLPETEPGKVRA
jgi:hypothetical protein